MLRSKTTVFFAAIVSVGIAVGAFKVHSRRTAAAASPGSAPVQAPQGDLRQVMESRMHPEYTYLSFTIWHDQPLTQDKMKSIAASSERIVAIAHDLGAYESIYRQQGWSEEDIHFFNDKRMQLTQVAEELDKAAQKHDSSRVTHSFMRLDNTCQSCHQRFRKDLSWT